MLTPSTAWYEAFCRADAVPVMLVKIYDGSNTFSYVSSSMASTSDLAGTMVAVRSVAPVGAQLDPLYRKMSYDEIWTECDWDAVRPIVVNYRLKGKRMNIYLGTAELDEADFIYYATNTQIEEIIPSKEEGVVKFVARGQLQIAFDHHMDTQYYINKHPLECLYDGVGTGILEIAGLHSFDATSFDETQSQYDSINHLIVQRATTLWRSKDRSWQQHEDQTGWELGNNETAGSMAEDLCLLLNGHLVQTEDGDVKFNRFSSTAAAVDNWTVDDLLPGTSIEQEPLESNVINDIIAWFGQNMYDSKPTESYHAEETASQTAFAVPGESGRVYSGGFTTSWTNTPMELSAPIDDDDLSMILRGTSVTALSGNRAGMTIDADHPIYLLMDSTLTMPDDETVSHDVEIVKVTTIVRSSTYNVFPLVHVSGSTYAEIGPYCGAVTCVIERAQLGTTAYEHDNLDTKIFDITPIVILCDELLKRFAYGCPIIKVTTPMNKFAVQVGDLITITTGDYLAYGKDGLDTDDKWEVIGKQADPLANPPQIEWTLAYAYEAASITRVGWGEGRPSLSGERRRALGHEEVTQMHTSDGLAMASAGGLDATIDPGVASTGQEWRGLFTQITHEFTASKDSYVYLDFGNPELTGLVVDEQANGAPAPTAGTYHHFLGKAVSSAVAVTSVDQSSMETLPILGSKLKAGSGPLMHLAQSTGVLDNLTSVTTRVIDDLTDSTYARPLAAALSGGKVNLAAGSGGLANQLPEAQIGALAVTEGKIGALAVTEGKIGALAVTEGKIGALAVTEGKVGALAITSGKIGASAVTAGKIATGGVSAATQVATATLGPAQLNRSGTIGRAMNMNPSFAWKTLG